LLALVRVVTALRASCALKGSGLEENWQHAQPVRFSHDWRGRNEDPLRETEVRLLWNETTVFIRFRCQYRTLTVFPDAEANGRRNQLWDCDVAEVFFQPDHFGEQYYKEFEVSPNGQWLDLEITPQGLRHITSGINVQVQPDKGAKVWTADLAIPLASITASFDPDRAWRVNFFRCEGGDPERFYSAWQPTETEEPNFHVPQKFGILRFQP